MSSVFGNPLAQGAPGRPGPARPEPEEDVRWDVVMLSHLASMERELRRMRSYMPANGRQFVASDGNEAPGGVVALAFEGPKSGNDWYLERITVSAAGASAAGMVCVYAGNALDESNLLDCLGALTGNTPSRGVLDGDGTPYFVYGGAGVLVRVSGVVADASVQVRLQGREVLAGADPALRDQADY